MPLSKVKTNSIATGNITPALISSLAGLSVANTQITGNIASSQITSNPTLHGNVSVTGVIGVGGATPSTSGSGITFPASTSVSTNANTLDDYEEGTFTPTVTASSGSVTYGAQEGRYTKVGQVVTCTFWVQTTGSTLSGASVLMNGLPFAQAFSTRPSPSIRPAGFASGTNVIGGWIPGGTTYIQIAKYSSGSTADVAGSDIPGGFEYGGTVVYQTT
jgi:hypothetical protein